MTLDETPTGSCIFVDANIFIYHFSRVSSACRDFLARCESGELEAYTGVHLLLEIAHRLMLLEALQKGLIVGSQPVRKLKERPDIVRQLNDYNKAVRQIPRMRIRVITLTAQILRGSEAIRTQYGLLTNDSVSIAMMQKRGLRTIATHDSDLRSIPDLIVYSPPDIS